METKEKTNLYPSQINTKTISCRIATGDYVSFLQDAMSKGITLNDWLLMKIYSQSLGKVAETEQKEGLMKIYKWLKESLSEVYFRWEQAEGMEDWDGIKLETPEGIISLIQGYEDNSEYLLDYQSKLLKERKELRQKSSANLSSIKAEILTLAQTKITHQKDLKEFMSEVNDLLSELA